MRAVVVAVLAVLALLVVGCPAPRPPPSEGEGEGEEGEGEGEGEGGEGEGEVDVVEFVEVLDDASDVDDLKNANGSVKFLARNEDAESTAPVGDRCLFQNSRLFPAHLDFLN